LGDKKNPNLLSKPVLKSDLELINSTTKTGSIIENEKASNPEFSRLNLSDSLPLNSATEVEII
jgi:hypothetical protein